jgi:hypothetical protein
MKLYCVSLSGKDDRPNYGRLVATSNDIAKFPACTRCGQKRMSLKIMDPEGKVCLCNDCLKVEEGAANE